MKLLSRPTTSPEVESGSGSGRTKNRAEQALLDLGPIEVLVQPIVDVATGAVVAAEALARFPHQAGTPVEVVFAQAHADGWGAELEAACLRATRAKRAELPNDVVLTVNVSPDALRHLEVRAALAGDLRGIAVEIVEKAATDSDSLVEAMRDIRHRGGSIAIDDASTGYAGLLRLSTLRPDVVKLDRSLVTGAWKSDVQAVVIESLVSLARRIGAKTLGEGVETMDDLAMLAELDVDYAQGWAIARPAPFLRSELPTVVAACRRARRNLMDISAGFDDDLRGAGALTAALAASTEAAGVGAALSAASSDLGVDVVGLSMLTATGVLREITSTLRDLDPSEYRVADFPATAAAIAAGSMLEVHVSDADGDPAERALLTRDGFASLLLTPVIDHGVPLGILEFTTYEHHPWTRRDILHARTVAEHLVGTLRRIEDQPA